MLAAFPVPRTALLALLLIVAMAGAASAAPRVVASILPLHSLVAGVMQGVGQAELLLDRQQTPHSFSLRPSDARRLHEADILFWIGPALERPLQRLLQGTVGVQSTAMVDAPGVQLLAMRSADHDGHDHGHSGSDHSDPHIWLSPVNAGAMVTHIATVLVELDPGNAMRYRSNATRMQQQLTALDSELRAMLGGLQQRFAVFHDAYGYLEQLYGLHSTGSVTTHPERRPGAAHLRALRGRLVSDKVSCLFSEPQFDPRMVDRLSDGLNIRHAVLDPLGSRLDPGPQAYFELMRQIATTLHNCLQDTTP